ncbi:MAG: mechanosensitive ion channel family protein [Oscillospiraceae bacterium]|nr:mechanosensitive ion channel family protein [Oscillospiraceae bacterium]
MEQIVAYVNNFFEENSTNLLETVAILVVGVLLIKVLLAALKRILKKQNKIDPIIIPFIRSIIKVLLYLLLFITLAGKLGFSTTSLATILGAVGLALSLSLQSSLANIVNGILLMISKPFTRGSVVNIDGVDGVVDSIGLLYTKLKTLDKQVLIPNSDVATAKISDMSVMTQRRFEVKLILSYKEDIDHIREIVFDVINNDDGLSLIDPEPSVVISNLGNSGMEVSIRIWVVSENYLKFGEFIYEALKKRFDEEGVVIPGSILEVAVRER